MLIKEGINKEAKNKNVYKMLMVAVDIDYAEVVNVLLGNEADMDVIDNIGLKLLDIATYCGA